MDKQMQMTDTARAQKLQAEAERAEALRLADVQHADDERTQDQQAEQDQHVDMRLGVKAETIDAARDDQAQIADAQQLDDKRHEERRLDETRRSENERRDEERDNDKRRDEAERFERPESAHEQDERDADKRHEQDKRADERAADKRRDETIEHARTTEPAVSAAVGSPGAPSSFADAAAQSRVAIDSATVQERINDRFQREQQSFDQRIERSHAPAERERLTAERDLQKHEHLATQKSRLLSHPETAIGKDPEIRERLTNEVKEHHKEAQELRTKLYPENHAYLRVEQRGEAADLKSAQAGVHAAPPATVRKAEELEQRHEKVKDQVAAKERAPDRAPENKRELEK